MSAIKAVLGLFDKAYKALNTWVEPRLARLPMWITPNRVTLFRASLAVLVVACEDLSCAVAAATIFLISIALDYVDGALARGRNECSVFGAYIDPMADKATLAIVILYNLTREVIEVVISRDWQAGAALAPFVIASGMFFWLEVRLALVRHEDYVFTRDYGEETRAVKASSSGKVKMILQSLGVGLTILGFPDPSACPSLVGTAVILAAMPFAERSLRGKKNARR